MPSTNPRKIFRERVLSQRNLTIWTAILLGVPAAYAFQTTIGGQESGFLLLLVLAVGVPTAYDLYWPTYDRTSSALAWIVAAMVVAGLGFALVFRILGTVLNRSETTAGAIAFLVITLVSALVLPRLTGRRPQ